LVVVPIIEKDLLELQMGQDQRVFRLRYVGSRFLNARLPLDVLADLPAFRDLLVSYAKERWRASNPERQRLPKGFGQSISFDLVRIEDGSATPALAWNRQIAQASLEGFTDELEHIVDASFTDAVTLFADAGIERFPRALSSDQIKALNRFGAGLREGERIEFLDAGASNDNAPYLDIARRKSLITHLRNTYELRYEGIGRLTGSYISGIQSEQLRFNILTANDFSVGILTPEYGQLKVLTPEYGELSIKLSPERVRDEFDGNIESAVQFSLQIELDNQDKFQRVVETFDVELIDPEQWEAILRCRRRLGELKSLTHGWLDGTGTSISPVAIADASSFLDKRPSFARDYKISPMDTGGVSFEVAVKGWDYSIDFLPNGGVDLYAVEILGKGELEVRTFSAATDSAFLDFFDVIKRGLAAA
jgi:hypothetical protein